ncbi:MAG: MaoC family dehydratase [Actinomycetota bacterium]|nr:MaoC family dehydratase [Actinomycetota bacterium]
MSLTTAGLSSRLGQRLGRSHWHVVEQADANAFGATTRDEQWIHTDPERAASGPFGRTIAHGYLTLSLATALIDEVFEVTDAVMVVNYGIDRVRFPAPLPVGAKVRAEVSLVCLRDFPGGTQATLHLEYQVADQDKPCCVADVLLRYYIGPELTSS